MTYDLLPMVSYTKTLINLTGKRRIVTKDVQYLKDGLWLYGLLLVDSYGHTFHEIFPHVPQFYSCLSVLIFVM